MVAEGLINQYRERMTAAETPKDRLLSTAAFLSEAFRVKMDEIAIFIYDSSREVLVFAWPDSLKGVGSIPLNAHRCLVAKCALEMCGGLDNSFASTPHLHMFEQFISEKEKRIPIQKIMSVPVTSDNKLHGVIQIAKKGADRESSGVDFSTTDLKLLEALAAEFAGYVQAP
ncbi:MAG: GAF domain-containing protein [Geobacter sp.]|nr:GAF domain-containing protein [Geobacter sp.]